MSGFVTLMAPKMLHEDAFISIYEESQENEILGKYLKLFFLKNFNVYQANNGHVVSINCKLLID